MDRRSEVVGWLFGCDNEELVIQQIYVKKGPIKANGAQTILPIYPAYFLLEEFFVLFFLQNCPFLDLA